MDYGKAYTSGDSFRARAEQRHREYRAEELNLGWREWGHLLDEDAIASGGNFLTDAAMVAAKEREASGKGVDHKRTWGNMLSSQAMCFNIFGTLSASEDGRSALARSLDSLGYPVRSVESVHIEFTPDADIFGDQSSTGGVDCDVLVRFTTPDDRAGVLVMETKFVEPEFSKCGFRSKPEYRLNKKSGQSEKTNRCPEGAVAGCDGSGCRYQAKGYLYWKRSAEKQTLADGVCDGECPFGDHKWQLWTNHTLAHVLKPSEDAIALYAVCAPKHNKALLDSGKVRFGKLDEFSSLLRNPDSFSLLPIEDLIASLHETVPVDFPQRHQWLLGLNGRYVVE